MVDFQSALTGLGWMTAYNCKQDNAFHSKYDVVFKKYFANRKEATEEEIPQISKSERKVESFTALHGGEGA